MTDVLSHADSNVPIAPVVTVFAGDSNHGKSVVVRALYQAMKNRPNGIDLLRHGAKHGACATTLLSFVDYDDTEFDVVRRRGKSKNEYEMTGQDNPLKAFGLEVPDCISTRLNLSPHSFQRQQDRQFLLDETDGEVARVLGQTVGLVQIDNAFAHVRKLKTENDATLLTAKNDVKRETGALVGYVGVEDADALVELAEVADVLSETCREKFTAVCNDLNELEHMPLPVSMVKAKIGMKMFSKRMTQHMALESEVLLMDTNINALAGIPSNISTVACQTAMDAFYWATADDAMVYKRHLSIESAMASLEAIPPHVDTTEVAKLLEDMPALHADWFRLKAEVEALSVSEILLDATGVDHSDDVKVAGKLVSKVRKAEGVCEALKEQLAGLQASIEALGANAALCITNKTDLEAARDAIAVYRKENKTCRECGAKQEHWLQTE